MWEKVRFALLAVCVVAGASLAGCDFEAALQQLSKIKVPQGEVASISSSTTRERNPGTITVASFNIQVFGISKLKKRKVMDVLAEIVRTFDVVAIQEIRSKDQSVLPRFVELVNSDGSQYDYLIGERLGRTSSKEQYAFVFDATRIEIDRQSAYTLSDRTDLLHREPFVARFRTKTQPSDEAFTFTLVNIHTDPDETDQELDALDDAFRSVQHNGWREDDVILLGDLNEDEAHLGELGQVRGIQWVVSGVPTNTRGSKSYDNILFDSRSTIEHTGRWGVLNFREAYGLTIDEALDVSDHFPVWAEFSSREGGGRLAANPGESATR